jgi:hypothetical protein
MEVFSTNKNIIIWYNYYMTQVNNSLDILGKWTLSVNTPFGEEDYALNIEATNSFFSGSVSHEKGSSVIYDASFVDNTFHCFVQTEFPIKTTVSITADLIENNKIAGILKMDQYLTTSFIGVK